VCRSLVQTQVALLSLVDEIRNLLHQSKRFYNILSKGRVISRLFQQQLANISNSFDDQLESDESTFARHINNDSCASNETSGFNGHFTFASLDVPSHLSIPDSFRSAGDSLGLDNTLSDQPIRLQPTQIDRVHTGGKVPTPAVPTPVPIAHSSPNTSMLSTVSALSHDQDSNEQRFLMAESLIRESGADVVVTTHFNLTEAINRSTNTWRNPTPSTTTATGILSSTPLPNNGANFLFPSDSESDHAAVSGSTDSTRKSGQNKLDTIPETGLTKPKRSYKHKCEKCTETFKRRKDLEDHVLVTHEKKKLPPGRRFMCEMCGSEFR